MEPQIAPPNELILFVPHPESRLCTELARGSAIVGLPLESGAIRIYYEGNIIGSANLSSYRDKAIQAAGRMIHNYPAGYPTRARQDVDPREVIAIGNLEPRSGRLNIEAGANDLSWWLGPADLSDLGLS